MTPFQESRVHLIEEVSLAEKTGVRLDTVDIADGSGWQVDSTHELDVFAKGAVTIEVRYGESATTSRAQ